MFVNFDEEFMPFSPEDDACAVANRMVISTERATDTKALAQDLNWAPRRMNTAMLSSACWCHRDAACLGSRSVACGPVDLHRPHVAVRTKSCLNLRLSRPNQRGRRNRCASRGGRRRLVVFRIHGEWPPQRSGDAEQCRRINRFIRLRGIVNVSYPIVQFQSRHSASGPAAEARGCYQSRFPNLRSTILKIFQIADRRRVMIGTDWTPPIEPSFVHEDAAVWKTLRTGTCSAGHFLLLVGQLIGPGEPNATSTHPRDLIAIAIAQIPCPVCLVGLRRAWLRIRCRTVVLSSRDVRAHRFLARHARLRVHEAAI
jgi:hypothetical protein